MRIFLCDLTHQNYASELVPYGIGCIASYLGSEEVYLFKTVEELKVEFQKERPRIIGFSNYMWNTDLSCKVAAQIKREYPEIVTVFGGPDLPLRNEQEEAWIQERPYIDQYIVGEGEIAFAATVKRVDVNGELPRVVEGMRVTNLSTIPSPYLFGMLDQFLENPKLVPILESNRGCPFSCTFCVDGGAERTQVFKHSTERLVAELRYIADRYKGQTLFMADANFGMYQEDVEFSKAVREIKKEFGYPRYINASTGKNKKSRVIEVADNLDGALRVAASVQSLDADVLEKIKRTNISKEQLTDMSLSLKGANTYSELILGLPGDTREKHIQGICDLVDMGFDQIRMHQLTILNGSELSMYIENYQTMFRPLQRCSGEYDFLEPFRSTETEQIVIGHETFTAEDYFYCRSFALTVALFYNEKIFFELSQFLKHYGVKYSDFLKHVNSGADRMEDVVAEEYETFRYKVQAELCSSREDAQRRKTENLLYNTQGRLYYGDFFWINATAFILAQEYLWDSGVAHDEDYLLELQWYCSAKKGRLKEIDSLEKGAFHYDFVSQEKEGFVGIPQRIDGIDIIFEFEPWQKEFFKGQFELYGDSDEGLGKIIARSPMKHTYRKVSYA